MTSTDYELYDDHYAMLFDNVQKYLGTIMDIESILRHYLLKHNLVIVAKNDITSMCNTLGVTYNHWCLMYKNYVTNKDKLFLPYDTENINVLDVFLYKHSYRGHW